jgi:hypothetical protein
VRGKEIQEGGKESRTERIGNKKIRSGGERIRIHNEKG